MRRKQKLGPTEGYSKFGDELWLDLRDTRLLPPAIHDDATFPKPMTSVQIIAIQSRIDLFGGFSRPEWIPKSR